MIKSEFTGSSGETLSARIDLPPDQKPKAFALFAHCFTCNKNLSAVRNISRALTSRGFGVMRFDFTGLGESQGDFSETTFSHNIDDLLLAAQFLAENHMAPSLLVGHSLGGAAVVFAAAQLESVVAVVTVGAPSNPVHVRHLFKSDIDDIRRTGEAEVDLGGRAFTIKKEFLEDLENRNMSQVLANLRKALLVMHSPQDALVGIENAAEIYQAAWHPKSFISLDGADHLLTKKNDSEYVGGVIASWASRYMEMEEVKSLVSDYHVVGSIDDSPGFTAQIQSGSHSLIADEPAEVGGLDLGPSPYELVSTGLAACTLMTMKMYAQRKGWDMKEARVHVQHDRKHFEDCESSEENTQIIDHFDKRIELYGELDEKQRARLLDIAGRCPVNKMLNSEIRTSQALVNSADS